MDHHGSLRSPGESLAVRSIPDIPLHTFHAGGQRGELTGILARKDEATDAGIIGDIWVQDGVAMCLAEDDPEKPFAKPSLGTCE